MKLHPWIASSLLLAAVTGTAGVLAVWKYKSAQAADAAASNQPEPVESVVEAVARQYQHRATASAIGTVVALRSIRLRNEVAGTVAKAALEPGAIVDAGTVLVALDVSVEQAELKAQEAQAALAQTMFGRTQRMNEQRAMSQTDLDRAVSERDVALAQVARTKAVIARKTIRAPFRARVGIADVHPGQFLDEGTELTTLQGVDEGAHVDFAVAQQVAAGLAAGDVVDVHASEGAPALPAKIVAVDARIDPSTRNAMVRARIAAGDHAPSPGASVRVTVPVGAARATVSIPASALRKGPGGDFVFVLAPDQAGKTRAQQRNVRVAAMLGEEVVIESGVAAGERVAASGSFKLRDTALVALADAGNAPHAAGGAK